MDSLGIKIVSRIDHKLYTNITVDVGPVPINRLDTGEQQSIFWSVALFCICNLSVTLFFKIS